MIPIKHIGDLTSYKHYIADFKKEISAIINKGFIGKRKRSDWKSIEGYYSELPKATQPRYIRSIGRKGYKSFSACKKHLHTKKDILVAVRMLSEKEIDLLEDLRKDLDEISMGDVDKLKSFIAKFQPRFTSNKDGTIDKSSDIYKTVYWVFVNVGYEKIQFKEIVWKITNLKVCPYCNRTYIPFIHIKKGDKNIKGQLDHFFPKETYPYLAVSVYNLVPSCSYCNGSACKSIIDPNNPKTKLVNPFSLSDHKGMRFRLKSFDENIFDLEKCTESIEIETETSFNPSLDINETIFHITDIYMAHRDIAAEIIFKYRAISDGKYVDFLRRLLNDKSFSISIRDISILYWGVPLSEDRLGERPLSKFTLDLINHLAEFDLSK